MDGLSPINVWQLLRKMFDSVITGMHFGASQPNFHCWICDEPAKKTKFKKTEEYFKSLSRNQTFKFYSVEYGLVSYLILPS